MKTRLLLVEDDLGLSMIVSDLLRAEGLEVVTAADGHSGLAEAQRSHFDLLILDWMLPGLSGLEICQSTRRSGYDGAILILTARGQVQDRVKGLKTGADDYLIKPFEPDELVARVKALLRRVKALPRLEHISFGDMSLDFETNRFLKALKPINLASKEAELLRYLLLHSGEVLTRDNILAHVWKDQPHITPRTVDTHIAWLRQKIEDKPETPRYIQTIRGEGYRFIK